MKDNIILQLIMLPFGVSNGLSGFALPKLYIPNSDIKLAVSVIDSTCIYTNATLSDDNWCCDQLVDAPKIDLHGVFACNDFLQYNRKKSTSSFSEFGCTPVLDDLYVLDHIQLKISLTNIPDKKRKFCYLHAKSRTFYPFSDSSKGQISRAVGYIYTAYPTIPRDVLDVDLMLQWNYRFPPNESEKERNDKVYQLQGNRNVFIDNLKMMYKFFSL
jgi:hypothetical protein